MNNPATRQIRKVLIANRGEIAVRIVRACRELGLRTVAVFSEADVSALHVRLADEAQPIGPAPAVDSYLRIDRILEAARRSGADALHPGYGFLSENPELPAACTKAGLVFVGPSERAMRALGSKIEARRLAAGCQVPLLPGTVDPVDNESQAAQMARQIGYPVMLKAAAGGGGKGMRRVNHHDELESSFRQGQSEARAAFGDGTLYLERCIVRPRHIEVQILGDQQGNVVHLGERECSIQRRHQKVIEEAHSPFADAALRESMGQAAVRLAERAGYTSAGTVEFLVDENRRFYFMEVNTRLQVEHPVTECLTGLDLVQLQLQIAQGRSLPLVQPDVRWYGHAIECRIYAEDPARDFSPSPGRILWLREPAGPGVRVDSGVQTGDEVPIHYDPLVAKLICWGATRHEAIQRMKRALGEYRVAGVQTTIPFFERVLDEPRFLRGDFDTSFIDSLHLQSEEFTDTDAIAATLAAVATQSSLALRTAELRLSHWQGRARWRPL